MAEGGGVPRIAIGCAFVGLAVIAVIAWLATLASLSSGPLLIPWLATAIGTTWVAYWLSRRWPGATSESIAASSASTGSDQYSWRRSGRWRLAYAVPWLAFALLYLLTFGGVMEARDYVLVLGPALFPAVGFLLIGPKGGIGVVAFLGIFAAGWLLVLVVLVDYGVVVSPVARWGLLIASVGALLASLIAFVVLPKKWVWDLWNGLP